MYKKYYVIIHTYMLHPHSLIELFMKWIFIPQTSIIVRHFYFHVGNGYKSYPIREMQTIIIRSYIYFLNLHHLYIGNFL